MLSVAARGPRVERSGPARPRAGSPRTRLAGRLLQPVRTGSDDRSGEYDEGRRPARTGPHLPDPGAEPEPAAPRPGRRRTPRDEDPTEVVAMPVPGGRAPARGVAMRMRRPSRRDVPGREPSDRRRRQPLAPAGGSALRPVIAHPDLHRLSRAAGPRTCPTAADLVDRGPVPAIAAPVPRRPGRSARSFAVPPPPPGQRSLGCAGAVASSGVPPWAPRAGPARPPRWARSRRAPGLFRRPWGKTPGARRRGWRSRPRLVSRRRPVPCRLAPRCPPVPVAVGRGPAARCRVCPFPPRGCPPTGPGSSGPAAVRAAEWAAWLAAAGVGRRVRSRAVRAACRGVRYCVSASTRLSAATSVDPVNGPISSTVARLSPASGHPFGGPDAGRRSTRRLSGAAVQRHRLQRRLLPSPAAGRGLDYGACPGHDAGGRFRARVDGRPDAESRLCLRCVTLWASPRRPAALNPLDQSPRSASTTGWATRLARGGLFPRLGFVSRASVHPAPVFPGRRLVRVRSFETALSSRARRSGRDD